MSVEGIDGLHRALLPDERHHGLRRVQNWIGGNDWNPSAPSSSRRPDAYLDGLTAYRYDGEPGSAAARDATSSWLGVFLDAAELAAARRYDQPSSTTHRASRSRPVSDNGALP